MNQSELIERVARASEISQAAAGQAVKAVVNTILDSLAAGEPVRVSGLGTFNVAERPARQGEIHKAERPSKSPPARQCGSAQARPLRMPSIQRQRLVARSWPRQRNPRCANNKYT
jgi:DNA-binding protein HU-beta